MAACTPKQAALIFQAGELGELLRARRKRLGYTQEQVAAFMGCSPRLIGEIEHGRGTVGIQKVLNLASGLGIDIFAVPRGQQ